MIDVDRESDTGRWIDKSLKGIWVKEGFTDMNSNDMEEPIADMLKYTMKRDGISESDKELILGSADEVMEPQRIWDDISGQELNLEWVKKARAE